MNAQDLLSEVEELTESDIKEIQLRASKDLKGCVGK